MNPTDWPFLFDFAALKPQTQMYFKRVAKKLYPGQFLEDQVFCSAEAKHLRKRGITSLVLIGAMAKDGRLDHESSLRYSPPFDAARALLTLDVSQLVNLEPGVDWQTLLRSASQAALDNGLYSWYCDLDAAYREYAGYEVEQILQVVSLRAYATLHTHADDHLSGYMPFDVSKAIFGFGTEPAELFRAVTWFKSWEAAERAKSQHSLASSWRSEIIRAMTNRYAYLWHLQGHSVESIVAYLRSVLPALLESCHPTLTSALASNITDVRVAHFLSAFPEHWGMPGFEIGHLLGVPYSSFAGNNDFDLSYLAEGVIHREGCDFDLQGPIIKRLHSIDPAICSAEYVDRLGTRQLAWTERVIDWLPAAQKLNRMLQDNLWHPALHGLSNVELLDGEASAAAALGAYLADGGTGNGKRAAHLIERYPQVVNAVLPELTKRKEIQRLTSILSLSRAQMQQLPMRLRDVVFASDLGL